MKTTGRDRPAALVTLALLLLLAGAPQALAESITLSATPVPLNAEDGGETAIGPLHYLGGLELRSDAAGFGGFSALCLSEDGTRLIALTDRGHWLTARLHYDEAGRLGGIDDAKLAPMMRPPGRAFDPEALVYLPDRETLLVATERVHRLIAYVLPFMRSRPDPFRHDAERLAQLKPHVSAAPKGLATLGKNEGIEALVRLADGRLLAIEEGPEEPPDQPVRAWLIRPDGGSKTLAISRSARFRPTDATLLPNGDVIVLERRYTTLGGVAARLRRFEAGSLVPGATLDGTVIAELVPPVTVDNMEGIAIRQDGARTILMLVSDDNFSRWQRTLLLQFELVESGAR